jgi:hypothetical protein
VQLSTPIPRRREALQEWQELATNLLARTGLDYRRDIQPWLGDEITLAVTALDYDRIGTNGVQPGYLLATATKDTELAKEFLQISFSERAIASETELIFENYKGVNLISQTVTTNTTPDIWASAVVGDFVLFANHPLVLREAINNAQAVDLNLARADFYQTALQTIREPRIGLAFVNLPSASAWLDKSALPETLNVEEMLTMTLSLKPTGVAAETALIGVKGNSDRQPALSEPVGALAYLPSDSLIALTGTDLAGFWQQIDTGLVPKSFLSQLVKQLLAEIETPLGINFATDIFSWVKGEYALSLAAREHSREWDWLFIAEITPETDSKDALQKLDNLARQQGLSVGDFPIAGCTVTAWTQLKTASQLNSVSLNAEVKGAYTRSDRYIILANSLEAIANAVTRSRNAVLADTKFQDILPVLPALNDGFVYVDFERGKEMFNERLPILQVLELAGQSFFSHLKTISLSSQGSQKGVRRATIFLNLET